MPGSARPSVSDRRASAAILAGPQTDEPPAYNGVGWLVVGNLGTMTSCAWLVSMAVAALIVELVRNRRLGSDHPASLARQVAFFAALGFPIRCAAEAVQLWTWNPRDVETAAWARTLKHYVDPIAVTLSAIAMPQPTPDGMTDQLNRIPRGGRAPRSKGVRKPQGAGTDAGSSRDSLTGHLPANRSPAK